MRGRAVLLWIIAFLITAGSAVYQRLTGPTYPLRGEVEVNGTAVTFRLPRSENVGTDALIALDVPDPTITGTLRYRRYRSHDEWTDAPMTRSGDRLSAELPKQPAAGKIMYRVLLEGPRERVSLSGEEPVVLRYKGAVPIYVLIPHVLFIFLAMLLANRTGLEAAAGGPALKPLLHWTVALLFLGGMILGPVVQKFAFDAFWTGVPFGHDLTDNKTLIAMLAWIWAWFRNRGARRSRGWILVAAVVTLAVYLIPHSVLGSELDYTQEAG
ncbi:MAG: hypothetical protein GF355_09745 [Candidatus Eisenbacteria bacterium]|nr:hypothetical protein [Candidatus Eisenbacteria bacterium]